MQSNTTHIFDEKNILSNAIHISSNIIYISSTMKIRGSIDFTRFNNITEIIIECNFIDNIFGIQSCVKKLNCSKNPITKLDHLVEGLEELNCSYNLISYLDNLPSSLVYLDCSHTEINCLDNLPDGLKILNCSYTLVKKISSLPWSITELNCSNTHLEELDYLPTSIVTLNINSNNFLVGLTNLPSSIEKLILNNKLNIHPIPKKLKQIFCPKNVMDINKIKKHKYKHSNKNYKLIK